MVLLCRMTRPAFPAIAGRTTRYLPSIAQILLAPACGIADLDSCIPQFRR
jgi:hypothetical protein